MLPSSRRRERTREARHSLHRSWLSSQAARLLHPGRLVFLGRATLATLASRLEDQLKALPARPGVYLFRDQAGDVLYVGKAKSLRPRVRS